MKENSNSPQSPWGHSSRLPSVTSCSKGPSVTLLVPVLQAFQATLKQLETVLATITGRETLDDPDPLAAAETPVQQAIEQRFASRRHYAHLSALFAILRRRNLLGRLSVAQAALELAQALLEDQEAIWQDFLQATEGTEAQVPQPRGQEEQNTSPRIAPASQEEEEHENIRGARGPLTVNKGIK